jgi:hypothetical protein
MLAAGRHDIAAREGDPQAVGSLLECAVRAGLVLGCGRIWQPDAGFGRRSPPITATGRGYRRTHRSGAGHKVRGAAEGYRT